MESKKKRCPAPAANVFKNLGTALGFPKPSGNIFSLAQLSTCHSKTNGYLNQTKIRCQFLRQCIRSKFVRMPRSFHGNMFLLQNHIALHAHICTSSTAETGRVRVDKIV